MTLEPWAASFLLVTIVGSVVAGVGYVFARRSGLGPLQAEYVKELTGLKDALEDKVKLRDERIGMLEKDLADETAERKGLDERVRELERVIASMALRERRWRAAFRAHGLEVPASLEAADG